MVNYLWFILNCLWFILSCGVYWEGIQGEDVWVRCGVRVGWIGGVYGMCKGVWVGEVYGCC